MDIGGPITGRQQGLPGQAKLAGLDVGGLSTTAGIQGPSCWWLRVHAGLPSRTYEAHLTRTATAQPEPAIWAARAIYVHTWQQHTLEWYVWLGANLKSLLHEVADDFATHRPRRAAKDDRTAAMWERVSQGWGRSRPLPRARLWGTKAGQRQASSLCG